MLCKLKFVKKLDCRLFIPCSNLIGYVTHVAAKFINWASCTSSLKLQLHPWQVTRLRATKVLLTHVHWTKPGHVNSRAVKTSLIEGSHVETQTMQTADCAD